MNEKSWIWICVQHPMPLLVQDRGVPDVLERIPPWGDPDLPSYLQKFRDVFDSMHEYPDFRMDFEISAREMEDVVEADPDIADRMAALMKEGSLGLIGGDYSQAHYHVYGPESCIRQISIGLRVFKEMFDYPIDVFFHQETGIHEQLPQILKAFGYTVAVPPRFPWAIQFLDGDLPELSSHYGTVEFVNGDEFVNWRGLDGTEIPLYLSMPAPSQSDEIIEVFQKHGNPDVKKEIFEGGPSPFEQFIERERQKHPVTVPPLLIENPDMKRFSEDYFLKRGRHCRFSLMGNALKERLSQCPPVSSARLYPYWAYIEGVWAEQLSRANRKAETAAVQAESLRWIGAFLTGEVKEGSAKRDPLSTSGSGSLDEASRRIERIWKQILSSQHHDIYWIETTDLKRKALSWLEQARMESETLSREALESIAAGVNTGKGREERAVILFNPTPHRRQGVNWIELSELGDDPVQLSTLDGSPVPSQTVTMQAGGETVVRRLLVESEVPGLGYRTYAAAAEETAPVIAGVQKDRYEFENSAYRVRLEANGIFHSLFNKSADAEMLCSDEVHGNEIRGILEGGEAVGNRKVDAEAGWTRGKIADTFTTRYNLSAIAVWQHILFYHNANHMDFFLTLDFGDKGMTLGDFWKDGEKLNVYWPFVHGVKFHHDIPFGVTEAREGRPLYCTSWIDASTEKGGVTYLNRGTTKHWLQNDVLANVLAWGGNWFSNRHPGIWEYVRKYDIRLYGKHTLEYTIYVHGDECLNGLVPLTAEAFGSPLKAIQTSSHSGVLAESDGIMTIGAENIVTTAVSRDPDSGDLYCRCFESCGRETSLEQLGIDSRHRVELFGFRGEKIQSIRPYQIFEMHFAGAFAPVGSL